MFAIETKNYRGEIYGSDNSDEWKQVITTDVTYRRKWWKTTKNVMYNPVKQALAHVYALRDNLDSVPLNYIIPIVVFVGDASLNVSTSHHVIYSDELIDTITSYRNECLSDADVESIVDRLINKDVSKEVTMRQHVRNIKKVRNEREEKLSNGICPRCGGNLVPRSGQYGSFYGCSNYPKCKFTTQTL